MKITNRFAEHILFLIFKLALFCFLSVHLSAHVEERVSRMRTNAYARTSLAHAYYFVGAVG